MVAIDNPPAFLQAGTYTASKDRLQLITASTQPAVDGAAVPAIGARSGFMPGPVARRAAAAITASWQLTVNPYVVVVPNTFAASAGDYQAIQIGNLAVTLTASSPTTNRIDIVGVRIQDAFYTGAINSADLVVVQGTPTAGAPSDPTLPASFVPILRATVNAASSVPILVDMRTSTCSIGGVNPIFGHQLAVAGSGPGDLRIRPAAGVFPMMIDYWAGDAIWRGTRDVPMPKPAQTGSGALGASATAILAAVSIPDPGWPYYIEAAGGVFWSGSTGNPSIGLQVRVDNSVYVDGAADSITRAICPIIPGSGASHYVGCPTGRSGTVYTGAHTARLLAFCYLGGTSLFVDGSANSMTFTINLVPA